MSSVNRPEGSSFIGNVISFAQNHLFSSRDSLVSTVAVLALTVGAGYLIVQGVRSWFATAAPQEKEEKSEEDVKDLFFRITGNNIPTDRQVYLVGSDDRPFNQYPENIVQSLKDCQVLVSSLPMSQRPINDVRKFVVDNLTLTLEKLKQKDEAWFLSQFKLIGCSGQYLEKQMERVRKAQNMDLDITLESWLDKLPPKTLPNTMTPLTLCGVRVYYTHPLIIMNLLGNELDLDGQDFNRIELGLAKEQENGRSYIKLEETEIMAASLISTFIDDLHHLNKHGANDSIQNIKRFCKRLEIGYSNDEESENDHLQQPSLYFDSLTNRMDPNNNKIVILQSTIEAKNFAWRTPILEALQENKSTAIVLPRNNLGHNEETGMIDYLESRGYSLELINT